MASFLYTVWFSTLVIFCLPPFIYKYFLKPKTRKEGKLPPGPPRLPIIGNLHQLGKLPHQSLWQLSQKYGPVMLLKLGNNPTLVISSAEMAKEVLKTQDSNFCSRPYSPGSRILTYDYIDAAFTPYGDNSQRARKIFVTELQNPKRLQMFWHARETEVNRLIESIEVESPNPVNLDEKMINLVDGVTCTVAFGKSYGGKQFKGQSVKEVVDEALLGLSSFSAEDYFPSFGRIVDVLTGQKARLEKCFNNIDGFFDMVINEHLHHAAKPKTDFDFEDVVESLLGLSKDKTAADHLPKNLIKAVLMDIFIGGTYTSAVTMVWAMTELIKNPRVMQKLQTEIRDCAGKKSRVEANDLSKLTYLKMVIKETLRLHPPAPLLVPHESIRHCKIGGGSHGGYDIYPKTRVLIDVWGIGRDPKSWKNPNEFYPERFENNGIDFIGQHFELLPFGAGRRGCPGINTSIPTIEFTLANLLHCFDWEVPSGMKREDISTEEAGHIVMKKKTPLFLVPFKPKCLERN